MFIANVVDRFNALDDAKVSMLTTVFLLVFVNAFLGIRLLMTGEGLAFMQQEAYVLGGLAAIANTTRAVMNRKKNGNGPPTGPA